MKISEIIDEALKPSQYRPLVKSWDKERYKQIFLDPKYEHDRNGYRVYIPLVKVRSKIEPPAEIEIAVATKGYEIDDYVTGMAATPDGKRKIKIGKLLPLDLRQTFANDPNRQATSEYEVVISRHPYDIAGMSTGRGWTSCMNIDCGSDEFVAVDIKEGVLVAYLIKKGDRDIKNPVARIRIKPFVNLATEESVFGIEDVVYGTAPLDFPDVVQNWVDEVNGQRALSGVIVVIPNPTMYSDSGSGYKVIGLDGTPEVDKKYELIARVLQEPETMLPSAPPDIRAAALSSEGQLIRFLQNPSELEQLIACHASPMAIANIKNPTEKVQISACKDTGAVIRLIKNPSEKVQLAAVAQDPLNILHIDNPTEKVQMFAVSKDIRAIDRIWAPTEKVRQYAASQNKKWRLL